MRCAYPGYGSATQSTRPRPSGVALSFALAANLTDIPGFLLLGGGVPLKAGNEVIGAIGIGGAPGGHLDEQCALAAIEANAALFK